MLATNIESFPDSNKSGILIIACGALAHELISLKKLNSWQHMTIRCLPADLHNTPQLIPDEVSKVIACEMANYDKIFVAYGDCGTGGLLDKVLEKYDIERLPGNHCYEFFSGQKRFAELAEQELGTFYLTDFLAAHFERIIVRGFGIDRHPELIPILFAHYHKLVYISQNPAKVAALMDKAQAAADRLGLAFEHIAVGYGDMENTMQKWSQA